MKNMTKTVTDAGCYREKLSECGFWTLKITENDFFDRF